MDSFFRCFFPSPSLSLTPSHFFFFLTCFRHYLLNLLQVHSSNRHGILLEIVQIFTDLDLRILKAFISSDGGWFMDGKNNSGSLLPLSFLVLRCIPLSLSFCVSLYCFGFFICLPHQDLHFYRCLCSLPCNRC